MSFENSTSEVDLSTTKFIVEGFILHARYVVIGSFLRVWFVMYKAKEGNERKRVGLRGGKEGEGREGRRGRRGKKVVATT